MSCVEFFCYYSYTKVLSIVVMVSWFGVNFTADDMYSTGGQMEHMPKISHFSESHD